MGFNEDLQINKYKLDAECENQANLYGRYAVEYAEAQAEQDKAENSLKLTMAEVDLSIRENSDKKPTESAINSMVLMSEEVKKAKRRLEEASERVYLLNAQVRAFEHKKAMLDGLIQLYIKNYYATPDGGKLDNDSRNEVLKKLNGSR